MLTLTIPLQQIDDEFATEISDLVLKNKGNVNVYIHVVDESSPNKVKLFSRQHRLKINTEVYRKLKKQERRDSSNFR